MAITKRSNSRTSCAGQFVSRSFVVLLRKSNPQNRDLQTAVVRGVKHKYEHEQSAINSYSFYILTISL